MQAALTMPLIRTTRILSERVVGAAMSAAIDPRTRLNYRSGTIDKMPSQEPSHARQRSARNHSRRILYPLDA